MVFGASIKWSAAHAVFGIGLALAIASALMPKLWQRLNFDYSEAVANMRRHAPADQQVLHAWPNGTCPAGYVLKPNMFELDRRHWDGCYKPGSWAPQLNEKTGRMELHGSIDFLLHLEVMHTPFALAPVPKDRKATSTHEE